MSTDVEKQIALAVEDGLTKEGWKGTATVRQGADGSLSITHVLDDGTPSGINFGGRISERRTANDLANLAVSKMADRYAYDRDHPEEA